MLAMAACAVFAILLILFQIFVKNKKVKHTTMLVLNRLFGFLFLTAVIVGIAALGAGYIATREEYPNTRETVVMTMEETRRFRFVPRIFLTQTETDEIMARRDATMDEVMDPTLIHVAAQDPQSQTADPSQPSTPKTDNYGLMDEDGDGYILVPVSGRGFNGYMLIVLDPTRCFVAKGGNGQTINLIAQRTGAIGGINGVPQDTSYIPSGVNPRTAIGQRADGAVLMLVINGRQLSSAGATYDDVIDVMLQFGAVNAMNLDGGSSTVMYLNGELVNTPSSESGYSRGLPDAFMFR